MFRSRSGSRSRSGGWRGSVKRRWRDGWVGRRRRSIARSRAIARRLAVTSRVLRKALVWRGAIGWRCSSGTSGWSASWPIASTRAGRPSRRRSIASSTALGKKTEKLWKLLPRGKARRGRRKRRDTNRTISDRRSIRDRPEAVLGREKLDDSAGARSPSRCCTSAPRGSPSQPMIPGKLAGKSAAETAATLMAVSSDWHRRSKARSPSTSRARRRAAPILQGPRP